MGSLFVYGTVLTIAVLISALTHRTVLSTALLFLAAGFLAGNGVLGLIALSAGDPFTNRLVEVTLVVVLFTDGMRAQPGELRRTWRLPGRALGLGLPLTLVLVAVLARWLAGLSWLEALLVGAALSATDPVLAASFVGQEDVPVRVPT
jgi:sodium/hydrogen antiporter